MFVGKLNTDLILGYGINRVGENPTLFFKDYIYDIFKDGVSLLSKSSDEFLIKGEDDFDMLTESEQKYAALGLNKLKIDVIVNDDIENKRALFRLYNVIKKE